jgi:hypothetical protein
MKLTLETQQAEMRSSFSEVHIRIDNLSTQLDLHRKETAMNFRQVDLRFDEFEGRFDRLEARVDKLPSELANILSPFFRNIEIMLENHEKRICALEQ